MFKKHITLAIAVLLINLTCATAVTFPQTTQDPHTRKVKRNVTDLKGKKNVSVWVKLNDGTKVKGKLVDVTDDHFSVMDKKSQAATSVDYQQVKKFRRTDLTTFQKIVVFGVAAPTVVMATVLIIEFLAGKDPH